MKAQIEVRYKLDGKVINTLIDLEIPRNVEYIIDKLIHKKLTLKHGSGGGQQPDIEIIDKKFKGVI